MMKRSRAPAKPTRRDQKVRSSVRSASRPWRRASLRMIQTAQRKPTAMRKPYVWIGIGPSLKSSGCIWNSSLGGRLLVEKQVEDENRDAHADDGIGGVESRKMMLVLPMEIKEVDDVPELQPIDQIADGSAHDAGKGGRQPDAVVRD